MSDNDVNKSKRNINGSEMDMSERMSNMLDKLDADRASQTIYEQTQRIKGKGYRAEARDIRSQAESYAKDYEYGLIDQDQFGQYISTLSDQFETVSSRHATVSRNVRTERQKSRAQADRAFQTSLQSQMNDKNVRTRVYGMAQSSGVLAEVGAGIQGGGGVSDYYKYEEQMNQAIKDRQQIKEEMMDLAVDPTGNKGALVNAASSMSAAEQSEAVAEKGMRMYRKLGLDPESQFQKFTSVSSGITSERDAEKALEQYKAGELSMKDLNAAIEDTKTKIQELSSAFEQGTVDFKELTEQSQELTGKLASDEAKKQAIMSGSGGGRLGMASNVLGIASAGLGAAKDIALDYEIEQTNQRAGFAAMANRQYFNVDKMLGGDMAALQELTKGDAFTLQFAGNMRRMGTGFTAGEAAAFGTDAAIAGVAAKGELTTLDAGGALQVGSAAAGGAANAVRSGARVAMGIAGGGYGLQGRQAALNAFQQLTAIETDSMQKFYNINRSSFQAGIGLGEDRGGFMSQFTSSEGLGTMARVGLRADRAADLVGQFSGQIGVTQDYNNMLANAGAARMRGVMSEEQYLGNTAALTNIGGGAGDLESIMSKAVTVGMENAKNINQMVQATSAVAAQSASLGMNVSSGAEGMISASVQSLRNLGTSRDLAAGAAANNAMDINKSIQRKGTMADLMFRAEAQSIYGDYDADTSAAFSSLTPAQFETLLGGGEKATTLARQKGLTSTIGLEDGVLNESEEDKLRKLYRAQMTRSTRERMGQRAFMDPALLKEIVDYQMGGDIPSEKAFMAFNVSTGGAILQTQAGDQGDGQANRRLSRYVMAPNSTAQENQLNFMDQLNAQRLNVDQAEAGRGAFDKIGDMEGFMEVLKASMEATPKAMEEAAQEAAKTLSEPGTIFKAATGQFSIAVGKFVQAMSDMGINVSKTMQVPEDNQLRQDIRNSTSFRDQGLGVKKK